MSDGTDHVGRFRAAFDAHAAIALLIDPADGRILAANAAACGFYEYSHNEMLRRTLGELVVNAPSAASFDGGLAVGRTGCATHQTATGALKEVDVCIGPAAAGDRSALLAIVHDVSAEAALAADFNRLYAICPELVMVLDADGTIQRCNPASEALLGRPAAELVGRPVLDFVHPDDRTRTLSEMRRRRQPGIAPVEFESRLVRVDGATRWFNWTTTWDAERGRAYVIARDITERIEREFELLAERERMALAQQMVHLGCWEWDLADETVFWTDETYRIFGREPPPEGTPITHAGFLASVHPDDRPGVEAAVEALLSEARPFDREFRILRPGGELRVVHSQGVVVRRGTGPPRMLGAVLDITERKEAELLLRESEERYRAIAEYTYDFEVWVGLDGKTRWANPAVERVTGCALPPTTDFAEFLLPLVDMADRAVVASMLDEALGGSTGEDIGFSIRHRDGGARHLVMAWQPMASPTGVRLGYRGSIRDVTRHRAMEAERERLVTALQDALAKVKTLQGMLPICANCKSVRDDHGYWQRIDVYIREHSEAEFSHGLCPKCARELYPDIDLDDEPPGE
jgi:PAS domain S-box-containing protein